MRKAYLYTDGASIGNPGPAGIGVILTDEQGKTLVKVSEPIGVATNNEAEYRALLRGLQEAIRLGVEHLVWYTDSELLACQWRGEYAVRSPNLQRLFQQARQLAADIPRMEVHHQRRELNRAADRLARKAVKPRDESTRH
ncbi:MAG: ribonuclease HI family protein [Fimbriimonadales bacterium]|nr:ribonuclease HI family protein [Fimbriimonadales bacterium]